MKIKSNLYTTGIVSLLFAFSHGANLRADEVAENNDSEPSQEMAFKVASTGESNRSYASRLRKYHFGMDAGAFVFGYAVSVALRIFSSKGLANGAVFNPFQVSGVNVIGASFYVVISFIGRLIISYKIKPKN